MFYFILKLCVYGNFMFEYEHGKGMGQWRNRSMYVILNTVRMYLCISFFNENRCHENKITLILTSVGVLRANCIIIYLKVVILFLLLLSTNFLEMLFHSAHYTLCLCANVFVILLCIVLIAQKKNKPIRHENSFGEIKLMIQSS